MHIISRYHDFSAGHVVTNHESACNQLHGHNYRITFHCSAQNLDDVGRVIDFSVIKRLLCMWLEDHWDHRFLVFHEDPRLTLLLEADHKGTLAVPFNPTAENMAEHLVRVVGPSQLKDTSVVLVGVDVEETRKCMASFWLSGCGLWSN